MPQEKDLSSYLRNRKLNLSPLYSNERKDPIFDAEDDTLNKLATMWTNYHKEIKTFIQRRLNQIQEDLVMKAKPEEVVVLRQAIVEIAVLLDEFEQISQEAERRRQLTEEKQEAQAQEEIKPEAEQQAEQQAEEESHISSV